MDVAPVILITETTMMTSKTTDVADMKAVGVSSLS